MNSSQGQTTFTLRVPSALQEAAKAHAKAEHISLNSLVVRLLEREVAQKEKPQ